MYGAVSATLRSDGTLKRNRCVCPGNVASCPRSSGASLPMPGPTCGTPAAPISGCTPVDIFNLEAPGQGDALKTISADSNSNWTAKTRGVSLTANGDVFQLPAGAMQAAVGFEYQKLEGIFDTDYLTQAVAPLYLTCLLASETCTADTRGSYNVKEAYLETVVPLGFPRGDATVYCAGFTYNFPQISFDLAYSYFSYSNRGAANQELQNPGRTGTYTAREQRWGASVRWRF